MNIISLNGAWKVSQAGKAGKIPAQVPGCIHTDLLAANTIPDPFHRDNELAVKWVGEAGWVYTREFDVPVDCLSKDLILLRCEGLDTFAAVRINGVEIGRADNMYRTWEFDVRKALKAGRNRIEVSFDSVLPYMAKRQAERSLPGWPGPREPLGRAYVRKEPCNCGWDWGPILVTCGIWRSISIIAFDSGRIAGVNIRQKHRDGLVTLQVTPEVIRENNAGLSVRALVRFNDAVVAETSVMEFSVAGAGLELEILNPQLWWPNGLGAQPLYGIELELYDDSGRVIDVSGSGHCVLIVMPISGASRSSLSSMGFRFSPKAAIGYRLMPLLRAFRGMIMPAC